MKVSLRSAIALLVIILFSAITFIVTELQILGAQWGGYEDHPGWTMPSWLFFSIYVKPSFTSFIVVLILSLIQYLIVRSIKNKRWGTRGIYIVLISGWLIPWLLSYLSLFYYIYIKGYGKFVA